MNSEELSNCCCGSTNLKELKPYGIESVQCRDCHVSLRKQDWNRVMGIPDGLALVPKTPSLQHHKNSESCSTPVEILLIYGKE
ncbi:hypothetical protein [Amphritea sp. HPY]|uniref:hypothetical protein n=1 Tax=Amphritea sp. HPY TaxID=3421652 RepID=UPI003D7EF7B5